MQRSQWTVKGSPVTKLKNLAIEAESSLPIADSQTSQQGHEPAFRVRALLRTPFLLAAMPAAVPEVAGCKVCNLRGRRCQSDSRDHVSHNKLTHWGHRDERALT